MKHDYRPLVVASALVLAGRVVMGCATDATPDDGGSPDPTNDASSDGSVGETSTPAEDAGADADADAATGTEASTCSVDGWCYTALPAAGSYDAGDIPVSTSGTTFSLQSVWVAPDHQAWAVSGAGHILRWNGTNWSVETTVPGGVTLQSVWGTSATDLWVAGGKVIDFFTSEGVVLHGTVKSGKMTFEPVTIDAPATVTRVWGTSASDMWAISAGTGSIFGGDVSDIVYHLDAAPGSDAGAAPQFVPFDVPSGYDTPYDIAHYSAIWGTATDVWIAGSGTPPCDSFFCDKEMFVARRKGDGSWDHIVIPFDPDADPFQYNKLSSGTATSDGLQLVVVNPTDNFIDPYHGFVLRIAEDAGALHPTSSDGGGITVDGGYAWTQEISDPQGPPEAIWATDSKDVWLAGAGGFVRHYDGTKWQIPHTALPMRAPPFRNLHAVHGTTSPSGERDLWIVGEDTAMHRTVKP